MIMIMIIIVELIGQLQKFFVDSHVIFRPMLSFTVWQQIPYDYK